MKIINVDSTLFDLTVDSTLITVDSILYTADMTEFTSSIWKKVTLLPRIFPDLGSEITVKLRHEITNTEFTASNVWNYKDGYMNLTLLDGTYELGEKYELNVLFDDAYIYRGKILAVSSSQDIQNYRHTEISTNKKLTF